jgi:hypothetical protein
MLEGHLGERAIAVEEPWRRSFTLGDLRSLCRSSDWLLSHPTQRVYYPNPLNIKRPADPEGLIRCRR